VVIVGTDKDSQTYVSTKRKACAEAGIRSIDVDFPKSISESELVDQVRQLNANPNVHGRFDVFCFYYHTGIDLNACSINQHQSMSPKIFTICCIRCIFKV
jgi:Tetrahydrofolate dehydrogenase/cyclohydrolase, catalytic domain